MLHAYCVRRAGDPPPDASLTGLDGAAVSLVENAGLGAWLSRAGRAEPTPGRLREHDRVVRAALRTATPLPIRFGAPLRDEAAVAEMLATRSEELLAGLARVSGRVEAGVTVRWDLHAERERVLCSHPQLRHATHTPVTPVSGRQYLERRRGEHLLEDLLQERARALLSRVGAALEADLLPASLTLLPLPEVAGMLAHLVPREEFAAYRRRFELAREALPEATLTLTGPWAPYSFVGDV
ncbi:GvpL/GvpF family gas vesicle protein [soil metagenome]